MSTQVVTSALSRSGAKYADSARKDINSALAQFKDLNPGNESLMYPDGKRRQNAFRLKGTIPVYYKGNCYNIPVTIFLWETHPYYAPICFVNPTQSMVIRESEHVNKEGRVFLPYLNEWRYPGYDLSGLIQVMAMVFQEKCPVFAKGSSKTPGTGTSSTNSTPQPQQPPLPTSAVPATPTPYPSMPSQPMPSMHVPYPTSTNQGGYNPYMNIPSSTPYPMGTGVGVPPYPTGGVPNPAPAPPRPPGPVGPAGGQATDTIRESILSALEARIRSKLRDKIGMNSAEIASIQATGMELKEGQQKLKKITDELETQRSTLNQAVELYTAKKMELTKALEASGGLEAPPIDEAIDASTPLHRQIVTNYAKDLTCDDVIYTLGQSLKHGKITLSEYLRRVRDVSREQFIHRATMQKCRRVAGLPI